MCTITVDATQGVARVIFDDSTTLGVQVENYKIGSVITVEPGQKKEFVVFNGDSSGSITFNLSFSSAVMLGASAILLAFNALI